MLDTIITFCATYVVFIIPLIAAIWWIRLRPADRWPAVVTGALTAVIGFATSRIASQLYYDPRPFVSQHVTPLLSHATDNGFPSDHTLLAAVVAFAVFAYNRKLGAGLLVLAVIVGAARVAAHVHSPIDIIGSLVIGGLAALVAKLATNYIFSRYTSEDHKKVIPS